MTTALTLLGLGALMAVIPKLVAKVNQRWFDNNDAMDRDYPIVRDKPGWFGGGWGDERRSATRRGGRVEPAARRP